MAEQQYGKFEFTPAIAYNPFTQTRLPNTPRMIELRRQIEELLSKVNDPEVKQMEHELKLLKTQIKNNKLTNIEPVNENELELMKTQMNALRKENAAVKKNYNNYNNSKLNMLVLDMDTENYINPTYRINGGQTGLLLNRDTIVKKISGPVSFFI